MEENFLELKMINELAQYSFYIPAYQRGYRWTEQQVVDLLNDINDFVPREIKNGEDKTWYCLQPIVVKQRMNDKYEVIDGQQRLTTIYLIWHYLNQDYKKEKQDKLFSIDYETREDTSRFLEDPSIANESNIDFFHISEAYKTIANWFEKQGNEFDSNNFRSKFKFHTKVVWYETLEENTISIFTRLNIGKISLKNAELIKALFLNSSNYNKESYDRIRLRQIEIATEWDEIEYGLQNDKLWYFLTNAEDENNRIELIFRLIADMDDKKNSDSYATFRFFSNKMKSKSEQVINDTWKEIKSYYQRFNEWYRERVLYHKIGFILYSRIAGLKELYVYSSQMKKSEFCNKIDDLIIDYFKKTNVKDLQYGDKEVVSILLLYNILTMLQNDQDDSYFPFSSFKKEHWDVEHIASVKDTMPDAKDRKKWLEDVWPYIDETIAGGKELKKKIEVFDEEFEEEKFQDLFNEIINHFNTYLNAEDDIGGLPNLTLLDATTNRGYKNAVFPIKRKTIIDRDKSGVFIPLCTKNVFLKYFSDYPPKISFWTKDDRIKYEEDLARVLNPYVGSEVQCD